jgi:hypothetical protein
MSFTKTLTVLIIALPIVAFSQVRDSVVSYWEVVQAQAKTKDQLFLASRKWVTNSFNNAKEVTQTSDKESGEIFCKGIIKSYYKFKMLGKERLAEISYYFSLQIIAKEGRYKYEFTDFKVTENPNNIFENELLMSSNERPIATPGLTKEKADKAWISMREQLAITVNDYARDLKAAIEKYQSENDF